MFIDSLLVLEGIFLSSLSYVTINQRKNDAPFLLSWRI